jgi:hypothetical protein
VQEVTLVYALANTFKDQDRLTQRDIDAAQKIVNIFSLTRSSKDVRDSISAISKQLESDIRRQEGLYRSRWFRNYFKRFKKTKRSSIFEQQEL